MFKLKIINKKSKQQTHGGEFSTVQEYEAWKQSCEAVKAWGEPESTETILVSEAIPEVTALQEVIVSPEEVDEETGEVIKEAVTEMQEVVIQEAVEAVYETKVIPAEYTIEVENITQQVSLEKSKQEQKKLAKEKRKADRKAIDFDKINTVKELKAYLKLYLDDLEG